MPTCRVAPGLMLGLVLLLGSLMTLASAGEQQDGRLAKPVGPCLL